MIAFAELERAARELGLDLVYAVGGTAADESLRWLAAGRGVAVVRPGDPSVGRPDKTITTYRVRIGGPTATDARRTAVGPRLMPDGPSEVTRWVLLNRLALADDLGGDDGA